MEIPLEIKSALYYADWFLSQPDHDITNMKLNKLLYISYAIYFTVTNKTLFKENIYAWKYGPVIPEIYHKFSEFRGNVIKLGNNETITKPDLNEDEEALFIFVWEKYSSKDGIGLMKLTHQPDSPWSITYESCPTGKIDLKLIKNYYQKILNWDN